MLPAERRAPVVATQHCCRHCCKVLLPRDNTPLGKCSSLVISVFFSPKNQIWVSSCLGRRQGLFHHPCVLLPWREAPCLAQALDSLGQARQAPRLLFERKDGQLAPVHSTQICCSPPWGWAHLRLVWCRADTDPSKRHHPPSCLCKGRGSCAA